MLGYWNIQNLPQQSVAFGRNLQTMVWFVGGALYEAARAVIQLKRAGLEARLVDLSSWHELLGFAKRWANKRELIAVRNKLAFHVDEDIIADGIAKTSAGGERLPLVVGDSEKAVAASLRGSEERAGVVKPRPSLVEWHKQVLLTFVFPPFESQRVCLPTLPLEDTPSKFGVVRQLQHKLPRVLMAFGAINVFTDRRPDVHSPHFGRARTIDLFRQRDGTRRVGQDA
jgi:hypothetical protein